MSDSVDSGAYTWEQYQQAMCTYAKQVQGQNYPGDDYYTQECWQDAFRDGLSPEEAVESDMEYWEPEPLNHNP